MYSYIRQAFLAFTPDTVGTAQPAALIISEVPSPLDNSPRNHATNSIDAIRSMSYPMSHSSLATSHLLLIH